MLHLTELCLKLKGYNKMIGYIIEQNPAFSENKPEVFLQVFGQHDKLKHITDIGKLKQFLT